MISLNRSAIAVLALSLFVVAYSENSDFTFDNKPLRLKRAPYFDPESKDPLEEPILEDEEQAVEKDQQKDEQKDLPDVDDGGIDVGLSNDTVDIGFGFTVPECGMSKFSSSQLDRIVGGRPATRGQFPWQVYLRIVTRNGEMLCGGSILNSNWILTAAHCISSEQTGQYSASAIEVVAGTLSRGGFGDSSRQSRMADCAFKHPGWRGVHGGFANDIALVRLPNHNPLNLNFQKGGLVNGICLPPKKYPPFDYSGIGRVSGWGLTRDRGVPARQLQYTDITLISDQACRRFTYPVNIIDSMVCQGLDTSSPCQGDSGGPLVIRQGDKYMQFGLVSFGPGICNNGRIPNSVFTQVSYHLDWIENTINTYKNSPSCQRRRNRYPSYPNWNRRQQSAAAGTKSQ